VLRIRGCFLKEPYPNILIPDPNILHPGSRILHEKWNANSLLSCFFWFQEQNLKVILKKFEIRTKIFPDPGGNKAPDTGTESATLLETFFY
jgi:hypothetical protein